MYVSSDKKQQIFQIYKFAHITTLQKRIPYFRNITNVIFAGNNPAESNEPRQSLHFKDVPAAAFNTRVALLGSVLKGLNNRLRTGTAYSAPPR